MAKSPSLTKRITARNNAIMAQVDVMIKGLPEGAPATRTVRAVVLRSLRLLGAVGQLSAKEARAYRTRLRQLLAQVFQSPGINISPNDLGAKNVDEVADLFLQMVERVRYGGYTLKQLTRKRLLGIFSGEMFERLVRNLRALKANLVRLAKDQRAEFNGLVKQGSELLINAKGQQVRLSSGASARYAGPPRFGSGRTAESSSS